jgi:hypothetical protein
MAARDYKTAIPMAESDPLQTVEIGRRYVNGSITWYDAQEEANSSSKTRIISFVNTLIDNGKNSLADIIAQELWQGGTGEHLHGLPAIVSATNTYMGINRSTVGNEWWKANVGGTFSRAVGAGKTRTIGNLNSPEPLVIEGGADGGIRALYNACCDNGGTDGPDFGITNETLYNKIIALIGAERVRYNEKMAEIGYPENIQYKGAVIVWDANCGILAGTPDTTTFYFLNSKYLKLRPYGAYAKGPVTTETVSLKPQGLMAKTKLMQWAGNLTCSRPSKVGALTGKTV